MKSIDNYKESDVIQANLNVFANSVFEYDDIVINRESYKRLEILIKKSIEILSKDKDNILALDACGGSGLAALILNQFGCETHLVDLSKEMVNSFDKRCKKDNIKVKSVVSEINNFLKTNEEKYDLIVFSSALHHLRFPEKVLLNATKILAPGGIIITVSDPTKNIQKLSFKVFEKIDRGTNRLIKKPKSLFLAIKNKLVSSKVGNSNNINLDGRVAELHAQYGINDFELTEKLISNGNYILFHKRYTGGYTIFFQSLYKILQLGTSFSLIISNKNYPDIELDI